VCLIDRSILEKISTGKHLLALKRQNYYTYVDPKKNKSEIEESIEVAANRHFEMVMLAAKRMPSTRIGQVFSERKMSDFLDGLLSNEPQMTRY
jgi:hypothetical protein